MKSLDRKLRRDLWHMKGQVLAIVLVIMSGISTFVMFLSTMDSLNRTRDAFYADNRFADVFASLKRAPESLTERIRDIPGVNLVETRVAADVKVDIPGFSEPVSARLVSLPDYGRPVLNRLYLRNGRLPEPGRDNEVVVSEAFAEAHGFSTRRFLRRRHQRALENPHHNGHRAVAGVRAAGASWRDKPGLQALRHPLDGTEKRWALPTTWTEPSTTWC